MPDDPKPPIADAASLYDTDELRPLRPQEDPAPVADPGGYELEVDPYVAPAALPPDLPDPDPLPMTGRRPRSRVPDSGQEAEPAVPSASVSASIEAPKARPKPKPAPAAEPTTDTSEFDAENSDVDPIWTRSAEWGSDAARLGMVAAGTLFLSWLVAGWSTWLVLLILALGGAAMVLLSYPILITLERPVRITAEQAVKDYFAAASHHFPHYRRMWLLLSPLARESGRFASFEEFREHWRARIQGWRLSSGAGKNAPLNFNVVDFRADKSTGKSTSKADYTVQVLVRGRDDDRPIASFRMAHGLVKGPDRMWYLNQGTLNSAKP